MPASARDAHPVLYAKLTSVLWAGFVTAIESSPDGITVKDVAAILGRLLGGVANAPQAGFATLAGILARTLAGYAILHMPGAVVQGADAQKIASSLVDALRQQKASITPAEAEQIRQELMRTVGAIAQLHRLHTALNTLAPVLVKLLEDFSR